MVAHVVPFCAVAIVMFAIQPYAAPVSLIALAQAWLIPGLYAVRGANRVKPRVHERAPSPYMHAEPVAQGLLGDLLGHDARELQHRTGLAMERGELGVWLVGEAGALLVAPGGRRGHCFCVGGDGGGRPRAGRSAPLLPGLRAAER